MTRPPPTTTLFPYTTLFRSTVAAGSGPITLGLRARVVAANAALTNTATVSSNELGDVSASATVTSGNSAPTPIPALPNVLWLFAIVLGLMLLARPRLARDEQG